MNKYKNYIYLLFCLVENNIKSIDYYKNYLYKEFIYAYLN